MLGGGWPGADIGCATGMESFEAKGDGLRRTDDQYTGGPGTAKVKYARGCTGLHGVNGH